MAETWMPIPGWDNLYAISSSGSVWSFRAGRLLTFLKDRKGYVRVKLSKDGASTPAKVHRLVAAAFLGPCPRGQEVRHLDGARANNDVSNLAYGTPTENMLDQVRLGMHYEAGRTHCDHGHEYTPENTRIDKNGTRLCRICASDTNRAWRNRNPTTVRERRRDAMRRLRMRRAAGTEA